MSGPARPAAPGPDPSMEDILASIRRILSEDEHPGATAASSLPSSPSAPPEDPGDVLVLDPGMMVPETPPAPAPTPARAPAPEPPAPPPVGPSAYEAAQPATMQPGAAQVGGAAAGEAQAAPPTTAPELTLDQGPLVDAQTRLAAASSVGNLVRTLSAGRAAQVHRGGPTLEDLVREMMRPLLKEWLDRHLPVLVERLVSAEIEKVVRNSGL